MKQHFVVFYSPGTFMSESTRLPVNNWDPDIAITMARNVKERHNATPYGFRFITKERGPNDLDSKQTKSSNMYYLGGTIFTLAEIKARNCREDKTLIWNMETNEYGRVIENTNSWKVTMPLNDDDVVLEYIP